MDINYDRSASTLNTIQACSESLQFRFMLVPGFESDSCEIIMRRAILTRFSFGDSYFNETEWKRYLLDKKCT